MEREPSGENLPMPQIDYVGDINKETSPFFVHLEPALVAKLFSEELGMTFDQIEKTRVVVSGKGGRDYHNLLEAPRDFFTTRLTWGSTSLSRDKDGKTRIRVNADNVIWYFKNLRNTLLDFSDGFENGEFLGTRATEDWAKKYTKEFFRTGRILRYLGKVGRSRASVFLETHLSYVVSRTILGVLAHEAKHVYDIKKDRFLLLKATTATLVGSQLVSRGTGYVAQELGASDPMIAMVRLGSSAVSGFLILYSFSSIERSANEVEQGVRDNYNWDEVVNLRLNKRWEDL